jgi:hypothetical protein
VWSAFEKFRLLKAGLGEKEKVQLASSEEMWQLLVLVSEQQLQRWIREVLRWHH